MAQKSAVLVYVAAEAWYHATQDVTADGFVFSCLTNASHGLAVKYEYLYYGPKKHKRFCTS
jgi:hypothetical protein